MAGRQNKVYLEYFEMDCHMDEKVRLIQAEYGLKGFAVFVKLLQEIYGGHGYYCEWNKDRELLFASENGLNGGSLLNDIVSACVKRKLFSERIYSEYGVLTSTGIQKQYLKATAKRDVVELKKEFLLVDIPTSRKNVVINSISVGRNSNSSVRNEQRREEKRKEKNNKLCKADALALFEQLWKMYPCKKGKGQVSNKDKEKLLEIGLEEMTRAINRYKSELEKDKEWRKPQNGSTFFHSGYVDYLDANFEESKTTPTKKSGFNNFKHNDYDFDELEKELLSK